ncbi:FGGY-family carbohydrate kinase (plasmid) [Shinella sp. H4-D48]|uniref:FGGY-family carbohydrate kinase n=1 Tax=Shinella sp. H4-D48 TaxID=2925841 RepID=UPI001F53CE9A|nr:FGGY-family carbohydrate kinase [Shinella sp. H4-D48]UNK40210.1 FGGY-family carbohydrate kinase [Shinella sp. H4-D48]
MAHILSFDFGTGGLCAGVYDTDRRQMLAQAEAPYATHYPRAGWAEQSPAEWRAALRAAGRAALEKAGRRTVDAVCTATTASTVAICRRDGTPLSPALLWMDCRAEAEARETASLHHPVMRYCGGSDAVEWLVPKAMWLKRNRRDIWDAAEVVCEALDYVNFDLAGEWVGSRMNAACKWNYDSAAGQFVPEVYEAFGIADLTERLPQRIVPVGGVIAPMRAAMAAELGLENQPIVAQGGIDAHIGILGADTIEPGGMLFIGGTSIVQLVQLAEESDVSGFWGPYPNALNDGRWLVECGQVAAGSMLNWLAGEMFGLDAAGHAALIAEVAANPSRSEGLLALDYMMGNRTPYRDAALRGALMGLTLGHTRADVYAASVDSIALGSANVLSVLKARGVAVDRVMMAGGIVKNAAWLQATVDAIGQAVQVAREDNLSLVGTAAAAAAAIGEFPDLRAAAAACVAPSKELLPDPARAEWFQQMLPLYQDATERLRPVLHQLASRQREA